MKNKTILKVITAFVAIFSLVACDNEPLEGEFLDDPINGPTFANFHVDIDGITFDANQSVAQTVNGVTLISGAKINGEVVAMSFPGVDTGTYSLFGGNGGTVMYATGNDSIPFTISKDTLSKIIITDYDYLNQVVSGTFSFKASRYIDPADESKGLETKTFTNGVFTNVPFQSDATPPVSYFIDFSVDSVDYGFEAYTADSMKRLVRGDKMVNDSLISISLWMPLDVGVGTYNITDPQGVDLEAYTANYTSIPDNINVDATTGTLEITNMTSTYFEGTFNFSGVDENGNTVEVIQGSFKAPNL